MRKFTAFEIFERKRWWLRSTFQGQPRSKTWCQKIRYGWFPIRRPFTIIIVPVGVFSGAFQLHCKFRYWHKMFVCLSSSSVVSRRECNEQVSVGGCTVKQAMYRCYHRLISWRATFRYCQMCYLLVWNNGWLILMTLNYEGSRSSGVKIHRAYRKPILAFLPDLLCVDLLCVRHHIFLCFRNIWIENHVT